MSPGFLNIHMTCRPCVAVVVTRQRQTCTDLHKDLWRAGGSFSGRTDHQRRGHDLGHGHDHGHGWNTITKESCQLHIWRYVLKDD